MPWAAGLLSYTPLPSALACLSFGFPRVSLAVEQTDQSTSPTFPGCFESSWDGLILKPRECGGVHMQTHLAWPEQY